MIWDVVVRSPSYFIFHRNTPSCPAGHIFILLFHPRRVLCQRTCLYLANFKIWKIRTHELRERECVCV
ncbi:hypothetical protein I7I48_08138 [Histoplasma ohiense]|nr:hypothetical protein I7I48_08138 [Histoplasma ohiense (nom. inval.)]